MNKRKMNEMRKQRHEDIPLDLNKLRWQVANIQKNQRR
jgi:hypothetical protein